MRPLTRNHFFAQVALGHSSVLVNAEGIVAVARHESPEGTWIYPQLGVRLTYRLRGFTARCWWAGIGGWAKAKPGHVTFLPPVIGAVAAMGPTMCVADRENGSYRCWEMVPEKCE